MRTARLIVLAAVAILGAIAPARAAGTVIYSGPGAYIVGYATPAMVAEKGGELTLYNTDIALHDVVAVEYGPIDQPWCPEFPLFECPLLYTPLIGITKTASVQGLNNVVAGKDYQFYCSIHSGTMKGTLKILPG